MANKLNFFEFFVPKEQREYISYILHNCEFHCEYPRGSWETIVIHPLKNGEYEWEYDCITRERDHKILSFEEGFKKLYKYYKNYRSFDEQRFF